MEPLRKALNVLKSKSKASSGELSTKNPGSRKPNVIHETNYSNPSSFKNIIFSNKKIQYEEDLAKDPSNHELWFDYVLFVESQGCTRMIRKTYERAIAQVPKSFDKHEWRTFISIWIAYAIFEEMTSEDIVRARKIYTSCIDIIPHRIFTFSKMWLMYAQFEQRNGNILAARAILSKAVALCPRRKLFHGFIALELELESYEKCRLLYKWFIETEPDYCTAWIDFAKMEISLGEIGRALTILTMALNQSRLDMPKLLQEAYDDFARQQCPTRLFEYLSTTRRRGIAQF